MKRSIIYSILAVFAVYALVSCDALNDMIDRYPRDHETEGTFFYDAQQLQSFSNSFYSSLLRVDFAEVDSDIYTGTTISALLRGGKSRTTPSSSKEWGWESLRNINTMLRNLYRCPDAAVRTEYEALCRFFRAYFYFLKIRDFGDVPWYDHELMSDEKDELYKARDSRDYVMEKLLADLTFAEENLPAKTDLYRVTRWTAMAFDSRICLFEGTWRKYHGNTSPVTGEEYAHGADYYLSRCATVSEDFINNSPYTIHNTDNPALDYTVLFSSQQSPSDEVIMARSYNGALMSSHYITAHTFEAKCNSFTKKFVDAVLMADGTRFSDRAGWQTMEYKDEMTGRDPRLAQIMRAPGSHRYESDSLLVADMSQTFNGFQPLKFAVSVNTVAFASAYSDNDIPIIRAGEIYLNYAEAQAERSDRELTDADITLSIHPIRKRAGMPDMPSIAVMDANPDNAYMGSAKYGYSNVTGPHKGTILEIRRERMVELIEEGDLRWYDLMRWKEGKCVEQDMYGMYISAPGEKDLDGDGSSDVLFYTGTLPPGTTLPAFKIGEGTLILTSGDSGYINPFTTKCTFDEERDYLFPVPLGEITINNNLLQNPGWKDIDR